MLSAATPCLLLRSYRGSFGVRHDHDRYAGQLPSKKGCLVRPGGPLAQGTAGPDKEAALALQPAPRRIIRPQWSDAPGPQWSERPSVRLAAMVRLPAVHRLGRNGPRHPTTEPGRNGPTSHERGQVQYRAFADSRVHAAQTIGPLRPRLKLPLFSTGPLRPHDQPRTGSTLSDRTKAAQA